MATTQWEIGKLHLRATLVWSMAMSSLKVRLSRAMLTTLTISTATAFMMYLLSMAKRDDAPVTDRQGWTLMLVLSLVVASAGVLNAMLMSVAQRYREIGTMKCLGALDSLIFSSVLVEAALLGLAGAVIGVAAGAAIALAMALVEFGGEAFTRLELAYWPLHVLVVFAVGMALTTIGAAVPAWIASRMAPVEAMRGEK
jgi:ABC-type lipoprotein release transport system permease subunit